MTSVLAEKGLTLMTGPGDMPSRFCWSKTTRDVVMVTEAFEQSGAPVRLQVVATASRPCSSSTGPAASPMPPRPDLIVLDLNLPRRTGLEILAA
jgi:CheY-like chemotaxis protein